MCHGHGICSDGPTGSGTCTCTWIWSGTKACSIAWGGIGLGLGICVGILVVAACAKFCKARFKKQVKTLRATLVSKERQLNDVAEESSLRKRLLDDKTAEVEVLQEAWRIETSDLSLDAFVARGGEGFVYRGRWRGQFDVAVKLIERDSERPNEWGFSNAEVKAMQRLRGSRLVHFYGVGDCVLFDDPEQQPLQQTAGSLGGGAARLPGLRPVRPDEAASNDIPVWDFVVLEWMAFGSLRQLIRKKARSVAEWPWGYRLQHLLDIAKGMMQMHSKRYVHRDLPVEILQNHCFAINELHFTEID